MDEVQAMAILAASLTPLIEVDGQLTEVAYLSDCQLTELNHMNAELQEMAQLEVVDMFIPDFTPVPSYDGAYLVTPLPYQEQTLNTNGKQMLADVTVHQIPFFSVSNPADGRTVYIGEP